MCSICIALSSNLRQCKTESEVAQAKSLKNNHRMNFGLARRKVEELKQSAIDFPGDHLFLQIDGMDNSKREAINKYCVANLDHSLNAHGSLHDLAINPCPYQEIGIF